MSIISVENLSFSYSSDTSANSDGAKKAVDNVSFEIEEGSYTALVGLNGSGKSTLTRIICGLLKQNEGTVKIKDDMRIGLVFQSPKDQLVSGIVSRDTAFGPQNLGLSESEIELRTIESLTVVDLLEKAQSATAALSLGQTQKVALSGMLAIWPDILILDEAVAMIDPDSRESIFEFLRYWHREGNTIIHVTHDLDAIKEAENIIGMNEGKLFFNGTSEEFFSNSDYEQMIMGPSLRELKRSFASDRDETADEVESNSQKELTLRFSNVSFSYDSTDDVHTLNNLNFNLYKGTLTAFTGPSGAGKSTVMELACGLLKAHSGEIFCKSIPVLAQQNCSSALFESFAADDVAFGPRNLGIKGKDLKQRVVAAMEAVNLPYNTFGDRQTVQLSGGEQRRLAIAGILAMDSEIVFFDEPTAGLDGKARYDVMCLLRKLAEQGKTVLFSTHKRDEARFADREIGIEKGQLVFDSAEDDEAIFESELKANPDANTLDSLTKLEPYPFETTLTRLRNVTSSLSGTKRKSKSIVEKLPAAIRILLFLLLFVCSLAVRPVWLCAAMLFVSIIYCKFAGFSLKRLLLVSIKILPFLLLFSVFQMIFHPALEGETAFTSWKWFYVTPSKLLFCLATILRTYASLSCISAFFISTPEYDLIDGMSILLKPLALIKIPVRYLILIAEIIFRFIPLLVDEASDIIKTQIIRGSFGQVRGIFAKIRAVMPLIVPLIIQTVKRSEALADAITMRCFK